MLMVIIYNHNICVKALTLTYFTIARAKNRIVLKRYFKTTWYWRIQKKGETRDVVFEEKMAQ